jgi:transcriptional regulator with XRE-family HTH domain
MAVEERRPPAIGGQIKRWRAERGLTLAAIAERSGLNVGYLSQIENDKASPSLSCLASIGDALDVPIAWFFMSDAPPPRVIRASDRVVEQLEALGRIELVDGGTSRDMSIVEAVAKPGGKAGLHTHSGDEHHLILAGTWRMRQGDHTIELGPGDYLRWDGTIPHDAEVIGPDEGRMLIITLSSKA